MEEDWKSVKEGRSQRSPRRSWNKRNKKTEEEGLLESTDEPEV